MALDESPGDEERQLSSDVCKSCNSFLNCMGHFVLNAKRKALSSATALLFPLDQWLFGVQRCKP